MKVWRSSLDRLLGRTDAAPAAVEDGVRIYAIGDIHGRADLLCRLLEIIEADTAGSDSRCRLVFLGDYLDRGEDSFDVIETCVALKEREGLETVFLKGNHEDAALGFLANPAVAQAWLRIGGISTLASYRVTGAGPEMSPERARGVAEAWRARLPQSHLDFLESLALFHRSGGCFFCHAGVHPALPQDAQPEEVLLWGASQFLDTPWREGLKIVHGHYAANAPVTRPHRICVDTGAFATGRLTALRLERREVAFLHTA